MNINSLIEDSLGTDTVNLSMNRKERDRLLRRADILKAAERIFALKGYHSATMQDIAKEAQYATGTVYLYFKDKEALHFSLVEEKLKDLLSIIAEKMRKTEDAKEKLWILVCEHLAFFQRKQDFFRIFVSERAKWQIESKISKSSVRLKYRELLISIIRLAQEQGIIRKDFDAKQIAEIFTSIFTAAVFELLKDESAKDKDFINMSIFILDIFLGGAGKK
jgi:TetR/AcrR family transcriptional regulator, fatty acid metabolism regulator protein